MRPPTRGNGRPESVTEIATRISLALVDGVVPGDYVILHVGYALNRLDRDEAEKTLALFAEMSAALGGRR